MPALIPGARQLPPHHLTVRVPWHDAGWDGTVCRQPCENTHCLVLPRIGESRDDAAEQARAGRRLETLTEPEHPPCVGERASFMSPSPLVRTMTHPYAEWSDKHEHFTDTPFQHAPYSAACVPFRWMLKKSAAGDAEHQIRGIKDELQLGYIPDREPVLVDKRSKSKREVHTAWVQQRDNQLVMLDTFFGAVQPATSLCFFYAKRTPLAEDNRRAIVGVGRVLSVGHETEYQYTTKKPPFRCVLWERNVMHSIRPGFVDGFLFPYQELIAAAAEDPTLDLADLVAFAPDAFFEQYSYGSELLPHDGAIASLIACASTLRKIEQRIPGPWKQVIAWVDREINRLWKARGAFPGLGSALSAFGLEQGNLIAYEIANAQAQAKKEWTESAWELVDAVFEDPTVLPGGVTAGIGKTFRDKWKKLPKERRALLELLSRSAISADQARRYWVKEVRKEEGIDVRDGDLLANPYRVYELDRNRIDAVAFGTVDRGLFPDPVIRKAFPVPEPSHVEEAIDARRVRAAVIHTLETAAGEGHTLLPADWVVQRVRKAELAPPCPLDEDTLAVTEDTFAPLIVTTTLKSGGKFFQLDRLVETGTIIREAIRKRLKGPRHVKVHDWAALVAGAIGQNLPKEPAERQVETGARAEKAAALAEVYASRVSTLIGAAGTGKTTLLQALCRIDEVDTRGVLLLAPTGKARVRLEEKTGKRGSGKTIAQFLNGFGRYDGSTGRYFAKADAPKCGDYRTVIIDECSMLTEEQLAAVLDALTNVERLVLVGDPRQLPPIGAGRPFVDIVNQLAPENVDALSPKIGPAYAELTVSRRQVNAGGDDMLLVSHFSGRPLDPGADEVWDRVERGVSRGVRLVRWKDANDLQEKIVDELVRALPLAGRDDEAGFEKSIGGSVYEGNGQVYFWAAKPGQKDGAASKAEDWQILSPVRGSLHGVDALNRAIQARYRTRVRAMATPAVFWQRKIPPPLGPQGLLWGDKVINLQNNGRRRTWPEQESPYVANGDIGIIVGEYKTQQMRHLPSHLEVELATQPSVKYRYWDNEFGGDDASPPLELAYALTVHKTQGSEFGITFVVLPDPCWLLSRELLYTALTRHKEELVILHQGPVRELARYGSAQSSEIARRVTNLFRDASPREVAVGKEKRFYEEHLIHRTERGELVRSKSEVLIADKLHARKVEYTYEKPVLLEGEEGKIQRAPDFTIDDDAGVTYYWEHLGMLNDRAYEARWQRKLGEYRRSGILPLEEGGGPNGTLIVTRDEPNGGIDSPKIAKIIDEVILGN